MFYDHKNQSQYFMTIFRNFKNQSAFYDHIWYHVSWINITVVKRLENTRVIETNKKQLKIALAVLDAVKSKFFETQEFIENTLQEECEKEKITADEVIFYKFQSKKLAWINIFVLDLIL